MLILQIFTTGFQLKRDAIFAYGLYDMQSRECQLHMASDLKTWDTELENLKDYLLQIQTSKDSILMFNGLGELSFLKFSDFSPREFYHHNVLDIYFEIRKLREITNLPNLKLQSIAREVNSDISVHSSSELFYQWEASDEAFDLSLLENSLRAIACAAKYLDELKTSMIREEIAIESYEGNCFYGHISGAESFFKHSDYYLYEEDHGQFKLELYPMEIAYDASRRCTYLPTDENFTNPVPMPEGYLLIRLEKYLNIQGILDLIVSIQAQKKNA